MDNLLLGGPASTAVAAIWACSLFTTPASSEMVPLGVGTHSGHVGPEALLVEQHGNNGTNLGIEPQASHLVFTTQTDYTGSRVHLRMSTTEEARQKPPTRFSMSMDLTYTRTMTHQEGVEIDPLDQTGLLRLSLDALGVTASASLHVHHLSSGMETIYQIEISEDAILELELDPGTYRLILEGTLDAEHANESRSHLRMVPAPAALWLLGPLLTCARRRRR